MNTSQSIMNDQHRATASEWACIRPSVAPYSCILELLHRVKALEATQHAHVDLSRSHLSDAEREKIHKSIASPGRFEVLAVAQSPQPNYPEIPDGSLLSRVACADGPADAILEVAAWLATKKRCDAAILLRQEAKR